MTADPDPPFVAVWNTVLAELNGGATTGGPINGEPPPPSLTPQQKAWLKLVNPLVITGALHYFRADEFVQNEMNGTFASRSSPP